MLYSHSAKVVPFSLAALQTKAFFVIYGTLKVSLVAYYDNLVQSFRLAKAEDDHQMAITEKLDLEARLNEELQMTKVCSIT